MPSRPLLLPLVPALPPGPRCCANCRLRTGIEPVRRLHLPVISIGNLSTGGSGKTPLTIALAKALTARGFQRRHPLPRLRPPEPARRPRRPRRHRRRIRRRAAARSRAKPASPSTSPASATMPASWPRPCAAPDAHDAAARPPFTSSTTASSTASSIATSTSCSSISRDWHDRLLPAGNLREPLNATPPRHHPRYSGRRARVSKPTSTPGAGKAPSGVCDRTMDVPASRRPGRRLLRHRPPRSVLRRPRIRRP